MKVDHKLQIPLLDSVQDIGRNYDAWLVDLWGVIHDGAQAIEPALEACDRYRSEGGIVILLSNAPRPEWSVREQIAGYGVPDTIDDGMVTSGEVARSIIAENTERTFHFVGPERDRTLFEGFDVEIVAPEEAEIVLFSGLYDDSVETPEDYRPLLDTFYEHDLPIVCANPDVKVERGNQVIWAAGAVAALYEQMGGTVIYAGKPHRPIYDLACAKINELSGRDVPLERILAIGDGVNTDIKGAVAAGIDPLFIPSPVHLSGHDREGKLSPAAIEALFSDKNFRPIASLTRLQW